MENPNYFLLYRGILLLHNCNLKVTPCHVTQKIVEKVCFSHCCLITGITKFWQSGSYTKLKKEKFRIS